jgi:ornithine cyclodeaminase/alanine dehydrogenase-like protein (mu-crystallin family)
MQTDRLLYLSRTDVVNAGLKMADIIEAVEAGFREKGEGRTEMPPKPGIHPGGGDNFIHAMPAYIPRLGSAGVKWVAGYPGNQARGLPYITGLLILNDPETGLPLSVMDCAWITAKRTGAATAVAARYLARPDSATLGVLGCGVQGRNNAEALKVLFPLKRLLAYDAFPESAKRFAREMAEQLGVEATAVSEPRQAVAGCDVVVTAGPILRQPHRTIQPGWLEEGAFASLVDYDS